jgi:hypothetical protein
VAGSYEDWCGEHGVPESQCTRCNPDLIAEFKATGDWCAEHGLPESQCLECNPDIKIERPAKSDGRRSRFGDQPPKDRLKVRLATPETSQIVGIVTEKGRSTEGDAEFVVPARLVYDSAKRAEVNARSAGVVRSVLVDVGSRVRKGDPVVVLDSPEVGRGPVPPRRRALRRSTWPRRSSIGSARCTPTGSRRCAKSKRPKASWPSGSRGAIDGSGRREWSVRAAAPAGTRCMRRSPASS